MDLQGRINRLHDAAVEGTAIEDELLCSSIIDVTANGTANPGSMTTWLVTLDSRREAIFKRLGNIKTNTARIYGQDRVEANVHEVVAWRLAHAMGEPWEQLLPTAVLRTLDVGPGVLCNRRAGWPNRAVFHTAKGQAGHAAFWDALVGQQDRHATNFRFDAGNNRLALIDHAFSFARPHDYCHASMFLSRRRSKHQAALTTHECEALETLLDSGLHGLTGFLAEDRAEALRTRATRMLDDRRLPLPGDF